MKSYFGIGRNFSRQAFGVKMDYSLETVGDTLALRRSEPTPTDFLERFSYRGAGGQLLEDMLANNMGWNIFSARIADVFSQNQNIGDIELLPLPEKVWAIRSELRMYRVLGVKREIPCVDLEESDILWSTDPDGGKYISSFRECFLREAAIPDDADVFRLAEDPIKIVISSRLATAIAELYPTGFVAESIKAI